ncbi:hypothetical protein D0Z07_3138 [Hyphodiscus hymeniophilus]|uniref:Uncharacterized protein n=1 Tax=Hyphodiscus hymeniophilus TaxID=353542 RepID=A0A9P7AZ02_9HELO|nr:hypothetical protein D0Z07_3138 [Hyphodiscus hymeniophilus]
MVSSDLSSVLFLAFCATPVDAFFFWNRHHEYIHPVLVPQVKRQESHISSNTTALPANYTGAAPSGYNATSTSSSFAFSLPANDEQNLTVQGMVVTATIPAYAVCNMPGANSATSCATVDSTVTTSSCSTTLTAGFDRYVISDCEQNITFSTQSSYSVATVTSGSAAASAFANRDIACPSPTTYVQNVVTYYVSHWRLIASGDPSSITAVVCKTDIAGEISCEDIQEVWVVHTEFVPVTTTTIVSIDRFFQYPAVVYYGAGQSMKVDSGHVNIRTSISYATSTAKYVTSTAQQIAAVTTSAQALQTSTTISTRTVFTTRTVTITLQYGLAAASTFHSSAEPCPREQILASLQF